MITSEYIDQLKPGDVFSLGLSKQPLLCKDQIIWVAFKAYCEHSAWSIIWTDFQSWQPIDDVVTIGHQIINENIVRDLIECSETAYHNYLW